MDFRPKISILAPKKGLYVRPCMAAKETESLQKQARKSSEDAQAAGYAQFEKVQAR